MTAGMQVGELLSQLESSLSNTSQPDTNSFANAAQLINQLTDKLTNITHEQVMVNNNKCKQQILVCLFVLGSS